MFGSLFVSELYAQAAQGSAQPSILEIIGMPLAILVIMYFLILRPQHKKMKEQQELLKALKAGDEVVTSGGIIGRIQSVSDAFVTLDAGGNTKFKIQKTHIAGRTPKQAAASGNAGAAK